MVEHDIPGAAKSPVETPFVELRGVRKSFGGVRALKGVDLLIPRGAVVGLAGENGAGKSTLLKILSGVYQPDAGEVLYDGVEQHHLDPSTARGAGIGFVAQELALFENLTVAENILIGREPRRFGQVDRRALLRAATQALGLVSATIDPDALVRDLPFADRQIVEIARALADEPKVLVLDEPTSGLREQEVERLLEMIRALRDQGRSVVFITHRMSEMFAVCDSFAVLKDGESVATLPADRTTPEELVRLMVGRPLTALFPPRPPAPPTGGAPALELDAYSVPGTQVADITLTVAQGEIVGIAGLAGNGQTELLEAVSGLRPARGAVRVEGARVSLRSAKRAIDAGVVLVPEDRKRQGLILPFPVRWNLTLPTLPSFTRWGFVRRRAENEASGRTAGALSIRPADDTLAAGGLSGGNQQKVVIGRSLLAEPRVLVLADPTRGIDVGTKQEIYALLRQLADQGRGILVTSSDLSEMVGLCDRVVVMAGGRIVAAFSGPEITEEGITHASFSGTAAA
jgi:ABC-type sugar transport system ATPase subunit